MDITSLQFVLFMLLVLVIYHRLPRRPQNYWLLFVSYICIISWDWKFSLVLAAVTTINFLTALHLRGQQGGRRGLLWLGIIFNVLVLLFYRSVNFFIPELETGLGRLGIASQAGGLQILVPLGLSFYVLQAISYLVDVYRGQLKAESDFVDFSLYMAYFPKLVAGPIERARTFLPKLTQARVVDNKMLTRSIMLIFLGLTRKLLIGDLLTAPILLDVFEVPSKYSPPELMCWLILYAFALYNDFAGYTDMVRGVSGFFGIELSSNFQTPYFSRNFTEFWKRWHITLSEWLRDYIYFPIGRLLGQSNGNSHKVLRLVLPPMLTMLISGLWHGLSLHMLIWGGMHGLFQVIERIPALWRPVVPPKNQPLWRQGLGMIVVFLLVILAWVPFRWNVPAAFEFYEALLNWSEFTIGYRRLVLVIPIVLGSLLIDLLQYRAQDEFTFLKWSPLVRAVCIAMILFLVFIVTGGDFEQPFVYQAF